MGFSVSVGLAFIMCSLLWGMTNLLYAVMLRYLSPHLVSWLRCVVGSIFLISWNVILCIVSKAYRDKVSAVFGATARKTGVTWKVLRNMCLMSIAFDLVGNGLLLVGETHVPSGVASIVMTLEPLLAGAFSHILLQPSPSTRMNKFNLVGFMLGIAGASMAVYPTIVAPNDHDSESTSVVFVFLLVISATSFGFSAVLGHWQSEGSGSHGAGDGMDGGIMSPTESSRLVTGSDLKPVKPSVIMPEVPPLVRVAGQLFFSSFLWIPLIFSLTEFELFEKYPKNYSYVFHQPQIAYVYLIISGVFTTGVCVYLYYYLLHHIGSRTALIGFIIPIIGLTSGALLNDEWKGFPAKYIIMEITGMAIVLVGTGLAMYKPSVTIVPVDYDIHDGDQLKMDNFKISKV